MEQDGQCLLDLPTVVIEEILLYLVLPDRKNIRLTCKQLYELCNSDRICRNEKIVLSKCEDFTSHLCMKPEPALCSIGRSYYNLVIKEEERSQKRKKFSILPFFELNGTKVRSLEIYEREFSTRLLETLIKLCEGLCSLTLLHGLYFGFDSFTLKPHSITRPNVTFLKVVLPTEMRSDYVHRMFSIFPNVNHLDIEIWDKPDDEDDYDRSDQEIDYKTTQLCTTILEDIIELGCKLNSLKLNIPTSQLIARTSQFVRALPNLKDFSLHVDDTIMVEPEKWFSCFSNLASLELFSWRGFYLEHPPDMTFLLKNTRLKRLVIKLNSEYLVFNAEIFKKLLTSQLKIVHLRDAKISDLSLRMLDFPLELNRTVTDLDLKFSWPVSFITYSETISLFLSHFRGLVHLGVTFVTDSILQCIFQFQENLRSLVLGPDMKCSTGGFCGTEDGHLEYSINKLQKLEHLSLTGISLLIVQSDNFKTAFKFPRLKYLKISIKDRDLHNPDYEYDDRYSRIPDVLYENLADLQALRLVDAAMPSHKTISSLFKNLKHLNYLQFVLRDIHEISYVTFINSKFFPMRVADYDYYYAMGQLYYDYKLDRIVVTSKQYLRRILCSPKISSHEINWICL